MNSENLFKIKTGLQLLIESTGESLDREDIKETPMRFMKAFAEMTSGYQEKPEEILSRCFDQKFDQLILLKNIDFVSICEHHLLPFVGKASVGYIPNTMAFQPKVVGLSKLARLVDCFARRLQIQENLTIQIADALESNLSPSGIGVIIEATHFCMVCRGVRKSNASMITSDLRGVLREKPEARAEFMNLVRS